MHTKTRQSKMRRLWQKHVSLDRELVLAAKYLSINFDEVYDELIKTQRDIGENLELYYRRKYSQRYTDLLIEHVHISVAVARDIFNDKDPSHNLMLSKQNIKQLALTLHDMNHKINKDKIHTLLTRHSECMLRQVYAIDEDRIEDSLEEYETCSKTVDKIVSYILKHTK